MSDENRLGYDIAGFYFDRAKPITSGDAAGLFEECKPVEVCADLERTIGTRDTRIAELEAPRVCAGCKHSRLKEKHWWSPCTEGRAKWSDDPTTFGCTLWQAKETTEDTITAHYHEPEEPCNSQCITKEMLS